MIKSFKHKGLQTFFESGSKRGIQTKHANKLRMQLVAELKGSELKGSEPFKPL